MAEKNTEACMHFYNPFTFRFLSAYSRFVLCSLTDLKANAVLGLGLRLGFG